MRLWVESASASALVALSVVAASVPIAATANPGTSTEFSTPVGAPANVGPPTGGAETKRTAASADAEVVDQLRELVETRIDNFVDGPKERSALQAFYKARNYTRDYRTLA